MVTRIRQLLEHKQLTPTQFADLIGVGRPVVSHILSERNKPSLEVAQRIGSAFPDISLAWLLFGTGEMLAAEATGPVAAPASLATPVAEAAAPASEPLPAAPAPPEVVLTAIPDDAPEPMASSAPLPAETQPPTAPPRPLEALPRPFSAPQPVAAAPPAPVPATTPATALTAAPEPVLPDGATPEAGPAGPRPFRAARFVPAALVPAAPPLDTARPTALPAAGLLPAAGPQAALPAAPVAPPVTAATLPATTLPAGAGLEAAMLPFLSESGKAIRRIVIFYRDGSFADYQPE